MELIGGLVDLCRTDRSGASEAKIIYALETGDGRGDASGSQGGDGTGEVAVAGGSGSDELGAVGGGVVDLEGGPGMEKGLEGFMQLQIE